LGGSQAGLDIEDKSFCLYWGPNLDRATVFQAEVYAIIYCLLENIKRSYHNKRIFILSDSRAVLEALNSFPIKSKLVWNCFQLLLELAERNKVKLIWMPGHSGVEGNE
jgi:ribonuclease HI